MTAGLTSPVVAERRAAHDSLTRRASLNALASILDFGSRVAISFAITPILLSGLGRTLYGVWEILNRLVSHMVATDGRPTEALRLVVSKNQETVDGATHRRSVGSAVVVWLLFLPVVLTIGAVLTWIAPTVVKASSTLTEPVRIACLFLVGGTLAMTLGSIPQSSLQGMNLGYKQVRLQTVVNVVGGVLMAGAVVLGFGLVGLAAARFAAFCLSGVAFLYLARRHVDWFGIARPAREDVKRLFGVSVWIAIGDTITRLLASSDVVILGLVESPALVTTYVLTGYATKFLVGVLTVGVGAAMPGFGGLLGSDQRARAAVSRREIVAGTWLGMTAVGGTILLWNNTLLDLWVGPGQGTTQFVTLLIVLIGAETVLIRTYVFMIDAALQTHFRVRVAGVAAVTTLGCSLAGCLLFGLPGLCAGILAGRTVQCVANPVFVYRRIFRDRAAARHRIARAGRATMVTVLVFGSATWLGGHLSVQSWWIWIGGALATLVGLLALACVAGLDRHVRRALLTRAVDQVKRRVG